MKYTPSRFKVLRADRANDHVKVGDIVTLAAGSDFGLAREDTQFTGLEHISVSLKEGGAYPIFTIPTCDLERIIE